MNNSYQPQQEEALTSNVDYVRLLKLCLKYWWVFALSIIMCLGAVFIYNRYSTRLYKVGTVILLKESDKPASMNELTEGFGLSKEINNIENQKFIYSSPKNVSAALANLDFEITYFSIGKITDTEIYRNKPLIVEYDSTHYQPYGATFIVSYKSEDQVEMRVFGKEIYCYNYQTNSFSDVYYENIDTTFVVRLGEPIKSRMYSFRIVKNTAEPLADALRNDIKFYFNTHDNLLAEWRSCLTVVTDQEGGTIAHVSAVGTDRHKLADFLRAMNEAALQYNLNKKNETALRTLNFLNLQLKQTADSLRIAQEKLRQFKEKYNFASNEQYSSNLQRSYFDKEKELQELMLEYEYLKLINEKLQSGEELEDYLAASSDSRNNSLINRQLQDLIIAQQTLVALKNQNDNNPYKKQIIDNAEMLRNNLKVLVAQSIDIYQKNIETTRKKINDMISEADRLPKLETEYLDLKRNYKIQDDVYTFLLQKESEAQIAKASNVTDNDILQEPTYISQISPNVRKNYTFGFALGLLLPLSFFFFRELINNKIRTTKELKRTIPDITILGTVPQGPKDIGDTPAITDPQSAISESFRTLRAKLNFINAEKKKKTLLFSSCNAGEGKTFCSLNMGITFALTGQKCLILNYDLRRPRIEKALGIEHAKVITDYLVGAATIDDILIETKQSNLWIAPAGTIPPNPSELIASEASRQLIEQVKEKFDIIIIDTAPIGYVADCRVLEPQCDVFVFVVKAYNCEYQHLRDTIETIKDEKVNSLYFLFNGEIHHRNRKYYNKYGYGYYYSHRK